MAARLLPPLPSAPERDSAGDETSVSGFSGESEPTGCAHIQREFKELAHLTVEAW